MVGQIGVIVEGQSEEESVRILIDRVLSKEGIYSLQVTRPFRVKRNRVVKEGEIERAITQLGRNREGLKCIMVLLDADDDCPAALGPELLARCKKTTNLPVAVVIAKKEFECWFLGAKESLRGKAGIVPDAISPDAPEAIRGAKGRLTKNMEEGRRYLEVLDQPTLAAFMDLEMARNKCPSFDRFCRKLLLFASSSDDVVE